jgi:hypothetical protein
MKLTTSEKQALKLFAAQQGRQWKAALRQMWETGHYWGTDSKVSILQSLRNRIGPAGLDRVRPIDLI